MYDGFLGGLVRRYGWRKFQIAFWILTAIGVLLFIPIFISPNVPRTFWSGMASYAGMLMFCLGLAGTTIIPNRRRRYTVFEMALAHPSESDPVVEDQPAPDIAALHLPANIDSVTRKSLARFMTIATWLVFLALFVIWREPFPLVILVLLTLGILASLIQNHDVIIGEDAQRVRVTEDAIVVSPKGDGQEYIAWDAVRIFALIQQLPNGARVYMLSSGNAEVRWKHCRRTHWYSRAAPITSDEIYNQQMEALLSYAAARTGLPLIDMR
jgi:hypothetical protein